jgi:HK97 family phage prohead protease
LHLLRRIHLDAGRHLLPLLEDKPTLEELAPMRRHYAAFPISSVKADDDDAGTFEAIVAVFGNVDFAGDRIVEGAFATTIERWKASGDPIPVIWSHQWHDPAAYIGTVDPDNIAELPAGSDELPESIREFGGLRIKADLDTDDPNGAKVHKLLKSRTVREFSFAYDVLEEAKNEDDNINELLEIDLIEVGPTLKGANPLTELVGAKAFDEAFDRVIATLEHFDEDTIDELKAAIEAEVAAIEPDPEPDSKTLADLSGILDRLDEALKTVGLEVFITKAGARNANVDSTRIQNLHDLSGELGAECKAEDPAASSSSSSSGDGPKYLDPAALAAHIDADLIELDD